MATEAMVTGYRNCHFQRYRRGAAAGRSERQQGNSCNYSDTGRVLHSLDSGWHQGKRQNDKRRTETAAVWCMNQSTFDTEHVTAWTDKNGQPIGRSKLRRELESRRHTVLWVRIVETVEDDVLPSCGRTHIRGRRNRSTL